jgi:hypothetical protein
MLAADEDDSPELELVEIDIDEFGAMISMPATSDTDLISERDTSIDGSYNLWLNTEMGFRRVKRVLIELDDELLDQEDDQTPS